MYTIMKIYNDKKEQWSLSDLQWSPLKIYEI